MGLIPGQVVRGFLGDLSEADGGQPLGNGHIHGTYLLTCEQGQFVFQKLNSVVFPSPETIMDNIAKVQAELSAHPEPILTFLRSQSGEMLAADEQGEQWRCSEFFAGTLTYDVPPAPEYLRAASVAFATFGRRLSGLDPKEFHPTIPRFHDTPHRQETFEAAWEAAQPERQSHPEKEQLEALRGEFVEFGLAGLMAPQVPQAVAHNDTKLNNCLFYEGRPEVACVIDLDTVMAGSWLMDLGDLCRTSVCALPEDTTELEKVAVDHSRFQAVVDGYASVLRDQISGPEKERMVYSAFLMTYELALRFFTDHLQDDRYFGAKYPGHNLVRTRSQIRLAQCIAQDRAGLEQIVNAAF